MRDSITFDTGSVEHPPFKEHSSNGSKALRNTALSVGHTAENGQLLFCCVFVTGVVMINRFFNWNDFFSQVVFTLLRFGHSVLWPKRNKYLQTSESEEATAHDPNPSDLRCSVCGKKFLSVDDLNTHIKLSHLGLLRQNPFPKFSKDEDDDDKNNSVTKMLC